MWVSSRDLWESQPELKVERWSCCALLLCHISLENDVFSFFSLLIFFNVYLFLRQRQSVNRGGAEREGDTESETGSRLWAVSTEPDAGLEPTNCEIVTRAEVGSLTDWATQAPQCLLILETETEREQGRGRERGRHRIWNRLQALSCQHRARRRARTHKLWDRDLSRSQTLNWLSHPGAPRWNISWRIHQMMEVEGIRRREISIFMLYYSVSFNTCSWQNIYFYDHFIQEILVRKRQNEKRTEIKNKTSPI